MNDEQLREQLSTLKPHTDSQIPLGSLLSIKEIDAIMSLIHQRETGVRIDELLNVRSSGYATPDMDKWTADRLAAIKKEVGGKK